MGRNVYKPFQSCAGISHADAARARSHRWRTAIEAEDRAAVVSADIDRAKERGDVTGVRILERRYHQLRAELARTIALDALSHQLDGRARKRALRDLEVASEILANGR